MHRIGSLMAISLTVAAAALAEPIPIPNYSFESPPVVRDEKNPFGALPFLDDWDETAIGLADEFDQNTGVFLNTEPQDPDHITNCHLDRMAFMSSLIGNDLRQVVAAAFQPGRSYTLTVAVATSLTFPVGASEELEIALFFLDGGVEQVIASSTITGAEVSATALTDVTVTTPVIGMNDAWANQPIGVLIRPSTADPDDVADEGFWDADYVRVDAADAVPTLSVWGMTIALILIVGTGAGLLLRRTRHSASY